MLNNKGFTVVELIASFVFSSILALSLFAVILNYRDKEVDSSIETRLLAFKSNLMIDVEKDIERFGLRSINYCTNPSTGVRISRCIILHFMDGSSKTFEVKTDTKMDTLYGLNNSSEQFAYEIPYISYGKIRYDIPDGANVSVNSDYLLEYSSLSDGLESNTTLYKIRVRLEHNDLDADVDIAIVADGAEKINTGSAPYEVYNVGDRVHIQLNRQDQLAFRVIQRSGGYDGKVVLLYDDDYSSLVPSSIKFNSTRNDGNKYDTSAIQSQVYDIALSWTNADSVRLITSEEVGYIANACPKFRIRDAAPVNIVNNGTLNWLVSSSYWTMSSKDVSNESLQNKLVWYVDGTNRKIADAYVDSNYALRPVIEISKTYILYKY